MGYLEWAETVGRGDSMEEGGYEENRVHRCVLSLTMTNPKHALQEVDFFQVFFSYNRKAS